MTALLDELYALLTGFGIRRSIIDLGILAVLGITGGVVLRALIADPLDWGMWALGIGVGWLTFVCYRYMAKGGE